MANLQSQMEKFHNRIRLSGYKKNQDLAEKRDLLLKELRENINKDENDPKLIFTNFNQGSYAMYTGIKPLHKPDDYDIDVGLIFDLVPGEHDDYIANPVSLKKRIRKALDIPQRTVDIRGPCVTVQYHKDGEKEYHVDLANYRECQVNSEHLDLARGKEKSLPEKRIWDENDPKGLISSINGKFQGSDQEDERFQMRRGIRYLKRWRDRKFSNGAPTSISLTCAAYHWFSPFLEFSLDQESKPNDQVALKNLVSTMLAQNYGGRISINLPVYPHSDLLSGLTPTQMENFINRLEDLEEALQQSIDIKCPHEAAKVLKNQFGDEFEVPEKEETGEKSKTQFVHTGTAA